MTSLGSFYILLIRVSLISWLYCIKLAFINYHSCHITLDRIARVAYSIFEYGSMEGYYIREFKKEHSSQFRVP
jgi:hypothetical protein